MRSGLLVAAITHTPRRDSIPSSCVSNWFTTRSVTPVLSWPRLQEHKLKTAYYSNNQSYNKITSYEVIRQGFKTYSVKNCDIYRSIGNTSTHYEKSDWTRKYKWVEKKGNFRIISVGTFTVQTVETKPTYSGSLLRTVQEPRNINISIKYLQRVCFRTFTKTGPLYV
jgi:hypothetical protein